MNYTTERLEQAEQRAEAWARHANRLAELLEDLPDDMAEADKATLQCAAAFANVRHRVAQKMMMEEVG